MKVFIAGITAQWQYIPAFHSFLEMKIRKGDEQRYRTGGRGDVERSNALKGFYESKCDALMMCDLDHKFPVDALEKLRAHNLPMVSGHYMKRTTHSLKSIWQWSLEPLSWPYLPFINPPRTGMHKIAVTGMGCVLIQREVIEAVARMMPPGANPFEIGKLPDAAYLQSNFGSDYRFFYLAQKLGYELWGDADVELPHAATAWLKRDTIFELEQARKEVIHEMTDNVIRASIQNNGAPTKNAFMARIIQLRNERETVTNPDVLKVIDGQIAENEFYLAEVSEYAPPPEAIEVWKNRYSWANGIPEFLQSNLRDIKLPTFGKRDLVERAIEERDLAPDGSNEEEAIQKRGMAHQAQARRVAEKLNAFNVPGTAVSLGPGEEKTVVNANE
jgi:hypothetical protein